MAVSIPTRVKTLFVGYDTMIQVFQALSNDKHLTLTTVARLDMVPPTARIVSVYNVPQRRGFEFLIEDESFEEASPYEIAPELNPVSGAYVEDFEHPVLVAKEG